MYSNLRVEIAGEPDVFAWMVERLPDGSVVVHLDGADDGGPAEEIGERALGPEQPFVIRPEF